MASFLSGCVFLNCVHHNVATTTLATPEVALRVRLVCVCVTAEWSLDHWHTGRSKCGDA